MNSVCKNLKDKKIFVKVNKTDFGCFVKYGILPKKKVASFRVSPNALLLPGIYAICLCCIGMGISLKLG
jgi:hypothetical protein